MKKVNIGLDIGNGFITATLIEYVDGKARRTSVFPNSNDAIPSIIAAARSGKGYKIIYGLVAEKELEKEGTCYRETKAPIKRMIRDCENMVLQSVSVCYGGENRVIGSLEGIVNGFFSYIYEQIKEGIEYYKTLRCINDEIQIQNIAIGFPNNYKENSSAYMDTLAKKIQEKFGGSVKVLINTEAAYAGTLLLNLNILSDGEMGMIVDVGAGTTDIALVKAGRNSEVVAEASVDFGGRIVDDIIKYGTDRSRNLLCSVGNKSAKAMIEIKEWLFGISKTDPPSFRINTGDMPEEFCKTKIYGENTDYSVGLGELEDEIKNKIGKQINIPDGSQFKVVLTGGSCRLPKVKEVVDEALNEVFRNRTITIQYIYLDEYCAEKEKDRDIDNETFMSYAAALVAESRRESERINSDMPQTASGILVPQTGAFGIIALKAYIGRRNDIKEPGEWKFIKLTTIDSCYAGEVSKKIAGRFYRINGEGFVGIADDIYLLEEKGNLDDNSRVEDHEQPVCIIDENGELQQERGKMYKLHDAVRYIKVAFTPTYVDNSGSALVKDVNGNNITNISEAYNDTVEQTSGTYTYTYDLELTYNYDMKAGYDEKMQVLYQQNKERPTN